MELFMININHLGPVGRGAALKLFMISNKPPWPYWWREILELFMINIKHLGPVGEGAAFELFISKKMECDYFYSWL